MMTKRKKFFFFKKNTKRKRSYKGNGEDQEINMLKRTFTYDSVDLCTLPEGDSLGYRGASCLSVLSLFFWVLIEFLSAALVGADGDSSLALNTYMNSPTNDFPPASLSFTHIHIYPMGQISQGMVSLQHPRLG